MKTIREIIITVATFLIFMNYSYSQRSANNSLGNLTSHKLSDHSIQLQTDNGNAIVTVYDKGIIRVRIVKDALIENFSYAVTGKPVTTSIKFSDDISKLVVKTDLITLEISKKPVRFNFYASDGTLLNEDDPSFGTSWIGTEVTTYKTLQKGERFLGLGEKTGNLDRIGSAYDNWNTDNPRYMPQDDPLYVTIPFYIGVVNQKAYGIFLDNTHRSRFNFGASNDRFSSFGADDGEMDYYFMHDINIAGIIKEYTDLTGRMQLPPIWSLGFQQCRWSYFPDSEVLNIAKTFRDKKIPLDVMYLDIHYMDAYKIFTWHPVRFSQPQKLLNDLKELGIHTTVIVDPGIKVEKGYEAYEEGIDKDLFVKFPDGKVYTAQVWPGWCHFPDFTKPASRIWWGQKFQGLVNMGVDGFWNDMNEIASWGGGYTPHLIDFDWEGQHATYRQAKNVYGMQMARSTFEGTRKLLNGKRPFILTRAGYAGLQRYSALWTGDNQSSEEHMMLGTRLINSLGISGVSFAGVDVGGFSKDATPSLFARWTAIGTFTPFFRSHSHYDTKSAEPWTFGETVETITRNYIQFRYRMLPYLYSVFHQSTIDGMPVARTLAIDYTNDEKVYWFSYQQQYLFGPSFLIAPVESTKELVKVYLPAGDWYDFHTDQYIEGNSEIVADCPLAKLPVYIKAGSIIPLQKPVQSTTESAGDTLYLHVYMGKAPFTFNYYEDDGSSYNYENGEYLNRAMSFNPQRKEILLDATTGDYNSKFKTIEVLLHGFNNEQFTVNGKSIKLEPGTVDLLNALDTRDPLFIESYNKPVTVKTFTVANSKNKISIVWK
ncbi:MAG TPA: glycoside hydrolase family 31 protein [Lentimicrobium sp.]|nr:glycoside hydrolase family 31 protein [Lentimicrobium sp.]